MPYPAGHAKSQLRRPASSSGAVQAGGRLVAEAFDIPVGRVAVVADLFGNTLVLVDLSKGRYGTDSAIEVGQVLRQGLG